MDLSASRRPSVHGRPPPVAMTSPRLSARSRTASLSSCRKCVSPLLAKISGMGRPAAATIISSVSTKQRPRRRARMRPTELLPAPMNPTRMTLSSIDLSYHRPAGRHLPADGHDGGGATVCAVTHPAAAALGEIVIDPRGHAHSHQERNALAGGHHTGSIQRHADRIARAELEESGLLGGVPAGIAGADAVRHLDIRG